MKKPYQTNIDAEESFINDKYNLEHIYHYCDINSLEGILGMDNSNSSLWCFDSKYMNDIGDSFFLINVVQKFVTRLLKLNRDIPQKEIIKKFCSTLEELKQNSYYITSFSKNGDLLPMWRNYAGKNDAGEFAVKFNKIILQKVVNNFTRSKGVGVIGNVNYYNDSEIRHMFKRFIRKIMVHQELLNPQEIALAISDISPFVKHKAFSYEQEARLVINSMVVPEKFISFYKSGSVFKPYIEIDINLQKQKLLDIEQDSHNIKDYNYRKEAAAVEGVIIGPMSSKVKLIQDGLLKKLKLMKAPYSDITVEHSNIPIRYY